MEIALYFLIGAFAGSLSGMIGIGGGVVVVPLLASIFEHRDFPPSMVMHFATGTSLAIMVITTSASLRAHSKNGNAAWPIFRLILPGLVFGVVTGGVIADFLHSHVLRLIFGVLMLLISFRTFWVRKIEPTETVPTPWLMATVGFGLGIISGLLGVGGGAIVVPFLLYISVNIRLAVTVATACGVVSGMVGAVTYMLTGANEVHSLHWTTGYIYWPAFIGVAMATPLFAFLGANISYRLPVGVLQRLFAFFLLLVAIKLLVY